MIDEQQGPIDRDRESDRRWDVAVVGGGIAGLAAGAHAARAGAATVVIEAHAPGGRARVNEVAAGDGRGSFVLNQGAHAVYDAGELRQTLGELGVVTTGGAPSGLELWRDGRRHVFPATAGALLRTTALSPRAKAALGRLLRRLPRLDPAGLCGRTLDGWLAGLGLPDDADALVRCLARTATYAHAPHVVDAGAVVAQLQRAARGVTYVDGGWQTIVDGLAAAATAAGATVAAQTRVTQVRPGDGWEVVTAGGPTVRAAAVVLAAGGPVVTARLLRMDPGALGPAGPAVRAAALDVGLAGPAPTGGLFAADEPLYLSRHMPPARLGPPGADLLAGIRYLGPDEHLEPAAARAELWAHAGRIGISPDDDRVVMHRYLHELVVAHGLPLAAQGGLRGRPPVRVAGTDGLFLAGDWVGDTGLLADASAASARVAARAAVAAARARGTVAA